MKSIVFPSSVKLELLSIAKDQQYQQVIEILERGSDEELIINDLIEAQAIVDTARAKLLDVQLKYPYWDDQLPNYNEDHEEIFQDFQMGVFEKTVSYISQEFDVRTMS